MAGPLGGAGRSPTAATTEDEEDIDVRPFRGAVGISDSGHHQS
jgi:hypothetical protein